LRAIREDNLLEHALSPAILDEIAATEMACDGINNEIDAQARSIARIHAKSLCLRLNRKLTEVERLISQTIARNTVAYDTILKQEDRL
jgi:hypothetical protein